MLNSNNSQNAKAAVNKLTQLLNKIEKTLGNNFENIKKQHKILRKQPKVLNGQMKTYQLEALDWMIQLSNRKMNGILADDMGLGKTIQAISYLAYLKEERGIHGKHIIIAPLTTLSNWLRQIKKWFPGANAVILYATEAQRLQTVREFIKPGKFDIVITSYQGVVSSFNVLSHTNWKTLVLDEAHKIKNDQSQIALILRRYKSDFKLLLTGTPLSNHLHELWSLLNFILPDMFNQNFLFKQIQQTVKELEGGEEQKFNVQIEMASKFHKIISPFILRRTKAGISLQLPPKTQKTIFVQLSSIQLTMYRNYLKYKSVYGEFSGYQNSKAMQLRKICNHPYLFPNIAPKDAQIDHLIQSSGKMRVLDKLLNKIFQEDHKVLIFSQFTSQLDIIQDYCQCKDYRVSRIDGNYSISQRDEEINNFNKDKQVNIFLLSTKAGGLGINLVAANIVIIYDIDWNPQNDNQAMDRAYRIGQTKPVHVYKFVTEYTIQERMLEVQKYKLIWDELVIQKGALFSKKQDNVLSGLNYQDLANIGKGDIFRLELKCDDRTIEELIKLGDQKDKKKNDEIKQKLMSFIKTESFNPFQNQNQQKTLQEQQYKAEFIKISDQNVFKEKKKIIEIQVPYFFLYRDKNKIKNLVTKRQQLISQNKQIYQDLKKEILLEENKAFLNWSLKDYQRFIRACLKFDKKNYQQISKYIENKTIREVEQYSEAFFTVGNQYFQIIKDLKSIEKYQKLLQNKKKKQKMIQWKKQTNYKYPGMKTIRNFGFKRIMRKLFLAYLDQQYNSKDKIKDYKINFFKTLPSFLFYIKKKKYKYHRFVELYRKRLNKQFDDYEKGLVQQTKKKNQKKLNLLRKKYGIKLSKVCNEDIIKTTKEQDEDRETLKAQKIVKKKRTMSLKNNNKQTKRQVSQLQSRK